VGRRGKVARFYGRRRAKYRKNTTRFWATSKIRLDASDAFFYDTRRKEREDAERIRAKNCARKASSVKFRRLAELDAARGAPSVDEKGLREKIEKYRENRLET
jgi:hypothetical protein